MYQIIIQKRAKKFIDKLPANEKCRVALAISHLPDGENVKPMKSHPGLFRLRVGDYRIIYSIDNGKLIVYVMDAGNRGQMYNAY